MLYRGFHRKVRRVRKVVIGTLLMLALVLTIFAPGAAQAKKGATYYNCGNYNWSYTYSQSDVSDTEVQHCVNGNSGG
jgi:hypothetical protein